MEKLLDLTASGALDRGEVICVLILDPKLWYMSKKGSKEVEGYPDFAKPGHWVRVHGVLPSTAGEPGELDITIFTWGRIDCHTMSKAAFGRLAFEFIFGTL